MRPANQSEGEIFDAALACSTPAERAAYLDQACAGQPELRQRIEALLAAHEAASQFLEPKAAANPTIRLEFSGDEKPGDVIGHYKIREKIGEGGCGVVYVADQEQPVRRRVALKVVKLGMDTKQVVARFEAERQALALMDHPNIAKVLDAGSTSTGRPFFVMELVRGIRITDYCDQNNLSTEDRLKLFMLVCQAVQHAHQKGIIHRDIKPSNVLVTLHDGVPVPKVIDFGIAKATSDQRLTDKTIYTAFEQFLGTPAYMSPEQAEMSGLDIDTRSDIYSLGVLLYELLTGKTPFDPKTLMQAGIDQMRRIIREQEPPRPSTRLSTLTHADLTTLAKQRHAEAPKLIHLISGDLDWIVMKCLEKDRTRRYETANGLATEIQRHLSNEPIIARPPSVGYRIQKLARRNKLAMASATAILLALVAGLTVSIVFYTREASARKEAAAMSVRSEENAERARKALADIFQITEAAATRHDDPKTKPVALRLADSALENYRTFFKQSPDNQDLKADLAQLYQQQVRIYRRSFEIERAKLPYSSGTDYDELLAKITERQLVISNALESSRILLGDLMNQRPKELRFRMAMVEYYLLKADLVETGEYLPLLHAALPIGEELVREFPDNAQFKESLAELYARIGSATTNEADALYHAGKELFYRKQLAERRGEDSATITNAFFKLAATYNRIADLARNSTDAIMNLSNAINTVNADWNRFLRAGADTNISDVNIGKISALIQYQSKLANQLYQSGNPSIAAYWAQQSLQTAELISASGKLYTEGQMYDAYINLGDMLISAGRVAEGEEKYERVGKMLRGIARTTRTYYDPNPAQGFPRYRDAVVEADALWDKMIARRAAQTNLTEAVEVATTAAAYWQERFREDRIRWWPINVAALHRKAALLNLAGQTESAAICIEEATRMQNEFTPKRPVELIGIAKILAGRHQTLSRTNAVLAMLATNYAQTTVSLLTAAAHEQNLDYPEAEFSQAEMRSMRRHPEFNQLETAWKSQTEEMNKLLTNTLYPEHVEALRRAMANNREIKVKGRIAETYWSDNGKTFHIIFEGINAKDFHAVIKESTMSLPAAKLGGEGKLEKALRKGGELEFTGVPALFWAGNLQIDIEKPSQIVKNTPPEAPPNSDTPNSLNMTNLGSLSVSNATAGTNASPVLASGVVSAGDTTLLKQMTNQYVVVSGSVKRVRQARSNEALFIDFEETKVGQDFIGFIPNDKVKIFVQALGGDPKLLLVGKKIEMFGRPEYFHTTLEIILKHPSQLRVEGQRLGTANTNATTFKASPGTISASEPEALEAALGSEQTVEGIVSTAKWNRAGTVFIIEFVDPGFLVSMFASNATNILNVLGDNAATQLPGKPIQVKGKLREYGGRDPRYAGWPQIVVAQPQQIKVLPQ